MKVLIRALSALLCLSVATVGQTGDAKTSLIIEGGGLQPYCPALERLVETATVNGRIRIGYLPIASSRPNESSTRFIARMAAYGVQPADILIIDLTPANSAVRAESAAIVEEIAGCTAFFFGGGDQTRITAALVRADGQPTAALQAINDLRQRGGVIAGTSAGAAVQSETMISISGFPDDSIDDGMDALDFGLTLAKDQPARRGLLVTRGLGFLKSGIVDQHFSQYRGRLGRLSRAAIDVRQRYGFGIDEDAAIAVRTDGTLEILGPGHVTIVDSDGATCQDGPLGCVVRGIHVTCLSHGDSFDPATGQASFQPGKSLIEPARTRNNGNFLIPDIAGPGAVPFALLEGLADNTSRQQLGIALKHNHHYAHGYRFTFSKTDQTRCLHYATGAFRGVSITRVRLDIEPVSLTLQSPETALPRDILDRPSRRILEAIAFRGMMISDAAGQFRPESPVTRSELACLLAQTVRLEPTRGTPPTIIDVAESSPQFDEISLVVTAGLMSTEENRFRSADPVSREDAAEVLVKVASRYRNEKFPASTYEFADSAAIASNRRQAVNAAVRYGLLKADAQAFRPRATLTREEAAEAIYAIIGFPWDLSQPRSDLGTKP